MRAAGLNADAQSAKLVRALLEAAIRAQGAAFQEAVSVGHDHLFADVALFVTAAQVEQMQAVIAAVERVVKLSGWLNETPLPNPLSETTSHSTRLPKTAAKSLVIPPAGRAERGGRSRTIVSLLAQNNNTLGVFYGYDFHLNEQGIHLIEINSNAGGGFLNALLLDSQLDASLPGISPVHASTGSTRTGKDLEHTFLAMFQNEWRLARGDAPLHTIAIVDEQPEGQYLYPEFLLAKKLFESAGVAAHIVGPSVLQAREDGLYCNGQHIDLIYNRLTDFLLQQHPALLQAYLDGRVVLTPDPAHFARYADKRNLARLSDAQTLRALGANEADIAILQAGVPHTIVVRPGMEDVLWAERKQWFFKPNSGYGSKGTYRGEKLTRRVFAEILKGDYVAQKLAVPGERSVCVNDAEAVPLKYDVRCYVYDGKIQLVAARLYQGQTTNFRTPGGGFALVRVVE